MVNLPKGHARVQYKVPESTVQSARVHHFSKCDFLSCVSSEKAVPLHEAVQS